MRQSDRDRRDAAEIRKIQPDLPPMSDAAAAALYREAKAIGWRRAHPWKVGRPTTRAMRRIGAR